MLPNEVVTECLKDLSNGFAGIDGDSLPPWIRRSITNPDTITCTTLQNTAPVQKRLTENICTWTLKLGKTRKYPGYFFLYFPKCPEDFSSRGLILTIINHHRPLEPILDAKIPDIPNDHRSIHISIPRRNAYEIIGASGRFHSIFTAFWRTSIENGSLFHGDGHT